MQRRGLRRLCRACLRNDIGADRPAKQRVEAKNKGGRYIAYFQSFTNTYAPLPYLERLFRQALEPEEIVALSIATRPDCLAPEVISLLETLHQDKPIWVELGLQTIHPKSAQYIRRGYDLPYMTRRSAV